MGKPIWTDWWDGLSGLFYPNLCVSCDCNLPGVESLLCTTCLHTLPNTGYHQLPENPFTDRFIGRVPLAFGAAAYYFNPGGKVQRMLHQLKYHNRPDIGVGLGNLYGHELARQAHFPQPAAIIPVPLHPKKQYQRGYNQSEQIAQGLAEVLDAPVLTKALQRQEFTSTQTKKSRLERMANVLDSFALGQLPDLRDRDVLLVDDVLTTGATLEACALPLLSVSGIRISMVTLAMAE